MENRMKVVQDKLDSLYAQMETAKAELGKPFPQEEELRTKSARLAELNSELNIDERGPAEQFSEESEIAAKEKPSILKKLKSYSVDDHEIQKVQRKQEVR